MISTQKESILSLLNEGMIIMTHQIENISRDQIIFLNQAEILELKSTITNENSVEGLKIRF